MKIVLEEPALAPPLLGIHKLHSHAERSEKISRRENFSFQPFEALNLPSNTPMLQCSSEHVDFTMTHTRSINKPPAGDYDDPPPAQSPSVVVEGLHVPSVIYVACPKLVSFKQLSLENDFKPVRE